MKVIIILDQKVGMRARFFWFLYEFHVQYKPDFDFFAS